MQLLSQITSAFAEKPITGFRRIAGLLAVRLGGEGVNASYRPRRGGANIFYPEQP
jgi:hypothetical protein